MIKIIILLFIFLISLYIIYKLCLKNTDLFYNYEEFTNKPKPKPKSKKNPKNNTLNKLINQNKGLHEKIVVITGATGGIGYALSRILNNIGCKLILHGRSKKKVDNLVNELTKTNPHVIGVVADLSKEEDVEKMIQTITNNYPKVHALINNANSLTGHRELSSKEFKDWKKDMSVNIDSMFLLSNKLIKHMRNSGIKGRIINVSGYTSKTTSTLINNGSNILSKTFIDKFSDILAEENAEYNIAITTIRIDETINSGAFKHFDKIPIYGKQVKKAIDTVSGIFASDPSKIMPVFLYALKAPHHEINGKLISTSAYLENPKLSKIIPSYQILLKKNVYDYLHPTKGVNHNKDKDSIYLVKQNPYGMSPKVKKLIKESDYEDKKINTYSKYVGDLDEVLAKKLKVDKKQITFFKTEFDALKKIIEVFVPKYQEILTLYPSWNYLYMISKEKKVTLNYALYKNIKQNLQPDYKLLNSYTNQHTKLLYLSSPNSISGQHLEKDQFEKFLNTYPDNVPILIDQSHIEFSKPNKDTIDLLKYLDKNLMVMRSLNHFYGFENLELTFIVSDIEIANVLQNTQIMDMPLNRFNEDIARTAILDKRYNDFVRNNIETEKKRLYKIFRQNGIDYFLSEVNYILIKTSKSKAQIKKDLEKEKIILYASNDIYHDYWVLPIMDKKTNNKVLKVIIDDL